MMQPAFMSWQGFFELIYKSDRFVILDDVQFSPHGYQQRNRLFKNKNQVGWYTVPVRKAGVLLSLNETKIDESTFWRKKMWKRIYQNYNKASYFNDFEPFLKEWLLTEYESLASQNIKFIKYICKILNIRTHFEYSSDFQSNLKRSEYVIELLLDCGCDVYYCAKGSFQYMFKGGLFPIPNVEVLFQDFQLKPYGQIGSPDRFVPYLSIVDTLMNIGKEEASILVKNGTKKWIQWDNMIK